MKCIGFFQRCFAMSAWLGMSAAAFAQSGDPPDSGVQLEWNARLRHEQVDAAAYAPHAYADTLRLRLGIRSQVGHGWSYGIEGAGTASAEDHYNSGANGQVRYPSITDPSGAELNQAWLAWQGGTLGAKVGRQEVVLDNQRWVGNVAWRQFEQTFDAVALSWKPSAAWWLQYDWLERVNRVAGPEALNPLARHRDLNTHLLHAAWSQGRQQVTGYGYLHKDKDVATASTATYGVRWTGKTPADGGFGWSVEGAHQVGYANNPLSFAHDYWLVEPSWTQWGVTGKLGWEFLGGDGRTALQTPLASLHAFNGWDDQFAVTPAGGLQDYYLTLNGPLGRTGAGRRFAWTVAYHEFHADRGNARYGSEWDASLSYTVMPGLQALLKAADYRADRFGHDDTKLWLQLEWIGKQSL
ncbi:alginate export family protein [Dyella japonica]|uniref:Alginate export domain-containing protein n=1 Tax=Dyella japonica A8 TaxID=1217721 RepID=A0A075KB04_9GAMM|nr:alginate export family protein [Dyella japonica]AIF49413.1 hypothetical protein HY57_20185 [Dyella japonica A8]